MHVKSVMNSSQTHSLLCSAILNLSSLTAYSAAVEIVYACSCRGPLGSWKHGIHLTLWGWDCNAMTEPQDYITPLHLHHDYQAFLCFAAFGNNYCLFECWTVCVYMMCELCILIVWLCCDLLEFGITHHCVMFLNLFHHHQYNGMLQSNCPQ